MAANDFQIKFAQSRIDYFENEQGLNKGAGDKLKTLLKAIKTADNKNDLKAASIATAIKGAKNVSEQDKEDADEAAAKALKKVIDDIATVKTARKQVNSNVDELVTQVGIAVTSAAKIKVVTDVTADDTGDLQKTKDTVTNPLGEASKAASNADGKMTDIKNDIVAIGAMVNDGKIVGDFDKAIEGIKTKINDATTAVTDAKTKLGDAKKAAGNLVGKDNDAYKTVADDAKDVADTLVTDFATNLGKKIDTTKGDYATYTTKQKAADNTVVGDSPVEAAAKALLGGDVVKNIHDATTDAAAKDLYVNQAPTFLKEYQCTFEKHSKPRKRGFEKNRNF